MPDTATRRRGGWLPRENIGAHLPLYTVHARGGQPLWDTASELGAWTEIACTYADTAFELIALAISSREKRYLNEHVHHGRMDAHVREVAGGSVICLPGPGRRVIPVLPDRAIRVNTRGEATARLVRLSKLGELSVARITGLARDPAIR